MKTTLIVIGTLGLAMATQAQVLYNNLNGSQDYGDWDIDGASATLGANYGMQAAQVVEDKFNDTAITKVEENYWGLTRRSGASGVLIQVFDFSSTGAGSLVGSSLVPYFETGDTLINTGTFAGGYDWDISANVDITGVVSGDRYLVVEQLQGPNAGIAFETAGSKGTYLRDFSSYGYGGIVGSTSWVEGSQAPGGGISGNLTMEVTGGNPLVTPEPSSLCAFGLGISALLLRRKRRS